MIAQELFDPLRRAILDGRDAAVDTAVEAVSNGWTAVVAHRIQDADLDGRRLTQADVPEFGRIRQPAIGDDARTAAHEVGLLGRVVHAAIGVVDARGIQIANVA